MSEKVRIEKFLAKRRLAIVGVSRDPRDFSRVVFREFLKRNYDVVPVNPFVSMIEDRHCYARVRDIEPAVEAVIVMTPPEVTEEVVRDCATLGISSIWLHRSLGNGAISPNAVSFCREHQIELIEGRCPLMFLQNTGATHRFHRFLSKLFGKYPK